MEISFEGELNLAGIPDQMLVDEVIRRLNIHLSTDTNDLRFTQSRGPERALKRGVIFFEGPLTIDAHRIDDGEAMICVIRKGIHPAINEEEPTA